MIKFADAGSTFVVGFPNTQSAIGAAMVGSVYKVAQLSSIASSDELSNEQKYPYFSRVSAVGSGYIEALKSCALFYSSNGKGWTDVAIIASTNSFTISLAQYLTEIAEPELKIKNFQQILDDAPEYIDVELNEIVRSGARVIFGLIFSRWAEFIELANTYGLVGDHYVWLTPPTVSGFLFTEPSPLSNGVIAATAYLPEEAPLIDLFVNYWQSVDNSIYPYAGPGTKPSPLTYRAFDMIFAAAYTYDSLEKQGIYGDNIDPELITKTLRNVTFEGISGFVSFYPNGDRIGEYSVQYYNAENDTWITTAKWSFSDGYELIRDVYWYSNTTEIPDLDIREPFDYWSCKDKKLKTDETGKTVILHTPDSDNVDDIDSDYHCDNFIDCNNMSDENIDCETSYLIIFIVFGIITGICIIICILLIIFVIIFGLILKYRRLRKRSPTFLVFLLVTAIVGFSSIFSWFGKPHPASCFLQPWLLGLPAISMITILTVKNFRIWRIFRFPMKKIRMSDIELFLLWLLIMIPGIIIIVLWSAIATPTADMENDHYICTSRNSGTTGTIIFFSIFFAYAMIILLIGAYISIISRKIPSQFSETKLLTISIYHLAFLAVVIIPVNIVLYYSNPFVAWIIRTIAILYTFGATIFIQFLPIVVGIFIIDKGQNVKRFVVLNDKLVSISPDEQYTSDPSSSLSTANQSM